MFIGWGFNKSIKLEEYIKDEYSKMEKDKNQEKR